MIINNHNSSIRESNYKINKLWFIKIDLLNFELSWKIFATK